MGLKNFGAILSFAVELEAQDVTFYQASANNPTCEQYKTLFMEFAKDEQKNEKNMLRVRRENVTEMILEPIQDFTREPFIVDRDGVHEMSIEDVVAKALELEEKAEQFYLQAAEKIKALPEVSRALERNAKLRAAHKQRLASLT